jgi:hypothetical protein
VVRYSSAKSASGANPAGQIADRRQKEAPAKDGVLPGLSATTVLRGRFTAVAERLSLADPHGDGMGNRTVGAQLIFQ